MPDILETVHSVKAMCFVHHWATLTYPTPPMRGAESPRTPLTMRELLFWSFPGIMAWPYSPPPCNFTLPNGRAAWDYCFENCQASGTQLRSPPLCGDSCALAWRGPDPPDTALELLKGVGSVIWRWWSPWRSYMDLNAALRAKRRAVGMGWLWLVCLFHLAASLEEILLDTTGETSEIGWTTHPPDGWDEVSVLDDKKHLIRTFEVCNVAEPGQNNWLRTHFIERRGAHRVHIRLCFSVRDCASMRTVASSCKETFTLYYYQAETDMATQDLPEWREGPWTKVDTIAADESFSQVDITGKVVKMNVKVRSFGPLTRRGFYLAFQDSGACMSLVAVQVFFYKCPAVVRGFASFPETFAGGERTSLVEAVGTCVVDAEEASTAGSSGVRLHCNGEGEWMVAIGRCTCRSGYQPANDEGACKGERLPPSPTLPIPFPVGSLSHSEQLLKGARMRPLESKSSPHPRAGITAVCPLHNQ
ncbi:Ephrin type-B receptor 5 [Platysternon megacephalum]|uniref:Ephrin type-B receptor 5 n=1 Tax=Platysternon megacephalum TaxID=55544 RepID=A0A4D9DQ51_9SAUR|nr:Ephrin type-B receptor 5 [Platysternon megacephalum]